MQRRTFFGVLSSVLIVRGQGRARADCAMPETRATLGSDPRRALPRDGALLAMMIEDYDVARRPRVTPGPVARTFTIDADLSFVSGARTVRCVQTFIPGGLFRLAPETPLEDGEVDLVGFQHRNAAASSVSFAVSGLMHAPLVAVDGVSGVYSAHAGRSSRWGTPTEHHAEIVLAQPLPPNVHDVLFETTSGAVVRFTGAAGARKILFDASVGGSHCGGGGPTGSVVPSSGMQGRVVLVDAYGRTSRSSRVVRLG